MASAPAADAQSLKSAAVKQTVAAVKTNPDQKKEKGKEDEDGSNDAAVEQWKVKKLIQTLEAARG